jgi:hypothetical protein
MVKDLGEAFPGTKFLISYDDKKDFYHIEFEAGGKKFDLRFYKVWAVAINGVDGWVGCPRDNLVRESK